MSKELKKICHISSVHKSRDVRIFEKQCKSLASEGYDVYLIIPDGKDWEEDGVKVLSVNKPKNRFYRMVVTTVLIYRKAVKLNADVYHFHDPELIPVGMVLRLLGKKVIRDIHEDHPKQVLSKKWIAPLFRSLVSFFIKAIERFTSGWFSAIVTVTPSINRRFSNFGAVLIQNYPRLEKREFFNSEDTSGELHMTFVGGITSIRGIKEMLDALAIVNGKTDQKKLRFILVGSFETKDLENYAKNHEAWKYTDFMGWLDRDQVNEIMGRVRAGLVLYHPEPNHIDAQPNKLFEYMSNRLPVIASDFPLWREIIVSDNCGVLANPLDPEEIAEKILWILNNPKDAEEMGKNGHQAVISKYNWESESKKLIELYAKLLEL